MGIVSEREAFVTSQIVIPALRRDPLGCRKSRCGIATAFQRSVAAEEWGPAQGPSAMADIRRRGDDRVESVSPERIKS
jgi:hypothetical protein